MAHDKQKWNVDQILAEAHRVKSEYDHDRRKYRHSMSTTGCMRVPAALVVEMLSDGPSLKDLEWMRRTMELDRREKNVEIAEKQRGKWRERCKDAEARLAILEWTGTWVVRDVSPEERAVLDAARKMNKDIVENNHRTTFGTHKNLYSAILALDGEEKPKGLVHG